MFGLIAASVLTSSTLTIQDSIFYKSLEELSNIAVSSPTRTERTIFNTPASVTVFTQSDLKRMGIDTLEQLLNFVPGFNATRENVSGSEFAVGVRGKRTHQFTNGVLVLWNGQKLNAEVNGGALQFDRYISLNNVDKVEVIRGPGSSVYGANAFMAVVSIQTGMQENLSLSVGNSGQRKLAVNRMIATDYGNWSLSVSGVNQGKQNYLLSNGQSVFDPMKQYLVNVGFSNEEFNAHYFKSYFDHNGFLLFGSRNQDINRYHGMTQHLAIEKSFQISEKLTVVPSMSYRQISARGLIEVISDVGMAGLNQAGLTSGTESFVAGPIQEESSLEFTLNGQYQTNANTVYSFGVDLRRADMTNMSNQGNYVLKDLIDTLILGTGNQIRYLGSVQQTNDFITADDKTRDILSTSAQYQKDWESGLSTVIGIRYDHYNDFGGHVSPRGGLSYNLSPSNSVKLLYGGAYRAPSIGEMYTQISPVEFGAPNLQPETIQTWELAWNYQKEQTYATLTLYNSDLDDGITNVTVNYDPRYTYTNSLSASLSGIELEYRYQFNKMASLRLTYSHLFDQMSEAYLSQPEHKGNIEVDFNGEQWALHLAASYSSEVERATNVVSDSFWLGRFHFRYLMNDSAELFVKGQNLFNQDIVYPSSVHDINGILERKRTLHIGINYQF